jgi:hypothetical protein
VEKAVGIALTLQELRSRYPARYVDVFTALGVYEGAMSGNLSVAAGGFTCSWTGEYSRFNDQNGKPLVVQNQTKMVFIPDGAIGIQLDLEFDLLSLSERYLGGLTIEVDTDLDGNADVDGGIPIISRPGTYDIPVVETSTFYAFTIKGQGIKIIRPLLDDSYVELRIPYSIELDIEIEGPSTVFESVYSSPMNAYPLPSSNNQVENSTMGIRIYDMNSVGDPFIEEGFAETENDGVNLLLLIVIIAIAATAVAFYYIKSRKKRS